MNMWFYWVQYQTRQGHYNVFWKPGATKLAEYFTKHHPSHHNFRMRAVHLHCQDNVKNASTRVCSSSQNNILKKRPNQYLNKETHLQISKTETHR